MDILVDKTLILNKFFIPLSRFTDQVIVNLQSNHIDCVSYSTSDKQSIILYAKLFIKTDLTVDTKLQLNIGSLKKLINALNCINTDSNIIKLSIEKNNISYTSNETNFKYHLKEDGIITQPPINLEKILGITTTTEFLITSGKVDEILKASNFSVDSNKIYISMKDNLLHAELTDKTIPNLDSMDIVLTKEVLGTPIIKPILLRLDIFKTISTLKFDQLSVKLNDKEVVIFEIKDNDFGIKYITSCLVK
jgi:hypothetical protein